MTTFLPNPFRGKNGMALVLKPTARYMILCHDVVMDERWPGKWVLVGPISLIKWPTGRTAPLTFPDLCLYFVLTGGRGKGQFWVSCVNEETNEEAFASQKQTLSFEGKDPIAFYVGALRLPPCHFPRPGVYAFRLCFEDAEVDRCTVHVR
jgi:hypothetical protein